MCGGGCGGLVKLGFVVIRVRAAVTHASGNSGRVTREGGLGGGSGRGRTLRLEKRKKGGHCVGPYLNIPIISRLSH